ncbi:MAG: hypothetical protein RRY35_04000, partial [Clostridiales bacterium]
DIVEFVQQQGLFGDLGEGVPELAVFLSKNSRSAKKMSLLFKAMAEFAVDMSIACLWFYVVEYFATDLFSNRFTAAVEILRAAVYAAEEEEKVKDLAQELVKEMQNWESSLSQDETRRIYRAAEDTWQ